MLKELALLGVLLVAACGGTEGPSPDPTPAKMQTPDPDPAPACEAGRTVACPCAGTTAMGTQTCADDGSKWEECKCFDGTTPAPSTPPSKACGVPIETMLLPEEACPPAKPIIYVSCPMPYLLSGECVRNPTNVFTCCPSE